MAHHHISGLQLSQNCRSITCAITAMLVFKKHDLKNFRVVFKDNFHDQLFNNIPEDLEVRYLKSTNTRDKQNAMLGYIKKNIKHIDY